MGWLSLASGSDPLAAQKLKTRLNFRMDPLDFTC